MRTTLLSRRAPAALLAVFATSLTLLLQAVLPPVRAGAVGTGGAYPFAMAPAPVKGKTTSSYFQLNLSAGATAVESIVISDSGRNAETLKLSPAEGTTAPNSGVAYKGAFKPCAGTACWIGGLPSLVSLGAGQTKKISFRITVPGGTSDSQYLAGITAQPATIPAPVIVGKKGAATARAIVIDQITVGVAVTVGPLASLRSALSIPGVKATSVGATPRLLVDVRNIGQRFTAAKGSATCSTHGQTRSYVVYANTILPGQSAEVAVNAIGLPANSLNRCSVALPFGTTSTSWHGTVKISSLKVPKRYHVGPGDYASLPPQKFPTWAIYALVGGGILLLVLLSLLVVLIRRYRRHTREKAGPSTPAPATAD